MEILRPKIDRPAIKEAEEFDSRAIGIATTTFYPKWKPLSEGQVREAIDIDGIRGDLALETLRESINKGFQIVVVDARPSSQAFKDELSNLAKNNRDLHIHQEEEKGMSPGRRQAFGEVSALDGVKAIAWIEPEKVSMALNFSPQAIAPILDGTADIIIPKRDQAAFDSYPDYQVEWENSANREFNKLLKGHRLLPEDAEDMDMWFGPRFIKNDPDVIKLFLNQWEVDQNEEVDTKLDPELWPNATFLPVVAALWRDKHLNQAPRVVSIPVHYTHPAEQTKSEQDNDEMRAKREQQFNNIIEATKALIQLFEFDEQRGGLYFSQSSE